MLARRRLHVSRPSPHRRFTLHAGQRGIIDALCPSGLSAFPITGLATRNSPWRGNLAGGTLRAACTRFFAARWHPRSFKGRRTSETVGWERLRRGLPRCISQSGRCSPRCSGTSSCSRFHFRSGNRGRRGQSSLCRESKSLGTAPYGISPRSIFMDQVQDRARPANHKSHCRVAEPTRSIRGKPSSRCHTPLHIRGKP